MAIRGGLSTGEKLASRNPATRREGQRELGQQTSSQQQQSISNAKSVSSGGYSGTISQQQVEREVKQQQTQWKQVGKSSLGTPIYERTINGKTERVATSNITPSTKGFEVKKQSTKIGTEQQNISQEVRSKLLEQARKEEAITKINRLTIYNQLLAKEQEKLSQTQTTEQKVSLKSQKEQSAPIVKSTRTPIKSVLFESPYDQVQRMSVYNDKLKSKEQLLGEKLIYEERKNLPFYQKLLTPTIFLQERDLISKPFDNKEKPITQKFADIEYIENIGKEQLKIEQLEKKSEKIGEEIGVKYQTKYEQDISKYQESLQSKVNERKLSVEQANLKLEDYSKSRQEQLNKDLEKEFSVESKKIEDEYKQYSNKLKETPTSAESTKKLFSKLRNYANEIEKKENYLLKSIAPKKASEIELLRSKLDESISKIDITKLDKQSQKKLFVIKEVEGIGKDITEFDKTTSRKLVRTSAGAVQDPLRTTKAVVTGAILTPLILPLATAGGVVGAVTTGALLVGGGAYVVSSGLEIASQPTKELKEISVGRVGAELAGFSGGAKLGGLAYPYLKTGVRTFTTKGRSKLALERLGKLDRIQLKSSDPLKQDITSQFSKIEYAQEPIKSLSPTKPEKLTRISEITSPSGKSKTFNIELTGKNIKGFGRVGEEGQFVTYQTKVKGLTKPRGQEFVIQQKISPRAKEQLRVLSGDKLILEQIGKAGKYPLLFTEPELLGKTSEQIIKTRSEKPLLIERDLSVYGSSAIELKQINPKFFKSGQLTEAYLTETVKETRVARATKPAKFSKDVAVETYYDNLLKKLSKQRVKEKKFKSELEFVDKETKPENIFKEFGKLNEKEFDILKIGESKPISIKSLEQSALTNKPATIKSEQVLTKITDINIKKTKLKSGVQRMLKEKKGELRLEQELKSELNIEKIARERLKREKGLRKVNLYESSVEKLSLQPKVRNLLLPLSLNKSLNINQLINNKLLSNVNQVPLQINENKLIQLTEQKLDLNLNNLNELKPTNQPIPNLKIPPVDFGFNYTPPPPVFFGLPKLYGGYSSGNKKRVKRSQNQLFYTESFTSKVLGLDPLKVTKKQAKKLLETPLTGFEIRRGLIIK